MVSTTIFFKLLMNSFDILVLHLKIDFYPTSTITAPSFNPPVYVYIFSCFSIHHSNYNFLFPPQRSSDHLLEIIKGYQKIQNRYNPNNLHP